MFQAMRVTVMVAVSRSRFVENLMSGWVMLMLVAVERTALYRAMGYFAVSPTSNFTRIGAMAIFVSSFLSISMFICKFVGKDSTFCSHCKHFVRLLLLINLKYLLYDKSLSAKKFRKAERLTALRSYNKFNGIDNPLSLVCCGYFLLCVQVLLIWLWILKFSFFYFEQIFPFIS